MFSFAYIKFDSRFTSYDFKKMQRRSYYPHNHLISTATATSSGLASSRPGTPANDLRVENSGLRVEGHDVRMDGEILYNNSSLEVNGSDEPIREKDIVDMDNLHMGKDYP
jgi:serine/threonine kinase 32